ncbi:hypothetical protein SAMN05216249_10779 [Acetitomaculum ruminis DSM 5522]|uniref:Uncharacterized protein n=1 Tax=Acetitomaculum ruminis DSM 5522 TaxID=1120918 RepID=A0A1I0XQ49_9FIRM|nr:hypothetical protein [Acetitomaculum ruminis]SFB03175.1 hypothetical protein SAMN05216249_10779 [Acetitomaculum ruminis DSM 5522]
MSNFKFNGFGASIILISLTLLGMVTFATLSIITSNSNYKLSKKTAINYNNYYEACSKAQDILKSVDESLFKAYNDSENISDYYEKLEKSLSDKVKLEGEDISFTVDFGENDSLLVSLKVNYPKKDSEKELFTIYKWQTNSTNEYKQDNSLNVLGS